MAHPVGQNEEVQLYYRGEDGTPGADVSINHPFHITVSSSDGSFLEVALLQ